MIIVYNKKEAQANIQSTRKTDNFKLNGEQLIRYKRQAKK